MEGINFDQWDTDKNIPHGFFFSWRNEEFAVFFSNDREVGFRPAKQNPSEYHRELREAVELQEY